MSGHSKWSKVKHQKAVSDVNRGKLFTKAANAIIIAIREGSGINDPNSNFKLRLAIDRARDVNMPKENIERAIERAKGGGEGDNLKSVIFEAYGPKKTAFIIEGATDNNQRTTANIKNVLERGRGTLVSPGAILYLFDHVGKIVVESYKNYDEILSLVLDAGGDDVVEKESKYVVYTQPKILHKVVDFLLKSGLKVLTSELIYKPKTTIILTSEEDRNQVLNFIHSIESIEEIQGVYTNAIFEAK
ncbi:YebC/PmpR family DNA-binding transcriptional regulator [Candidatus Gottesmanbacteria bacterium]|nr:YebC/PmpR family DNA-binding transcriptional regulator [Candidatus Gottesmanbacteria bacterium]